MFWVTGWCLVCGKSRSGNPQRFLYRRLCLFWSICTKLAQLNKTVVVKILLYLLCCCNLSAQLHHSWRCAAMYQDVDQREFPCHRRPLHPQVLTSVC